MSVLSAFVVAVVAVLGSAFLYVTAKMVEERNNVRREE